MDGEGWIAHVAFAQRGRWINSLVLPFLISEGYVFCFLTLSGQSTVSVDIIDGVDGEG